MVAHNPTRNDHFRRKHDPNAPNSESESEPEPSPSPRLPSQLRLPGEPRSSAPPSSSSSLWFDILEPSSYRGPGRHQRITHTEEDDEQKAAYISEILAKRANGGDTEPLPLPPGSRLAPPTRKFRLENRPSTPITAPEALARLAAKRLAEKRLAEKRLSARQFRPGCLQLG